MERLLNKQEIESELERKQAGIESRIEAIKDEIQSTGDDVRQMLVEKPVRVATGVLAVGGAVALLVLLKRRHKRHARLQHSHHALIEHYMDALVDDVQRQRARGRDDAEALHRAFKGRLPLIVVDDDRAESKTTSSITRDALGFALNTALGFFVKVLMDKVASRMELDHQVDKFVQSIMPNDETSQESTPQPSATIPPDGRPVEPVPPPAPPTPVRE